MLAMRSVAAGSLLLYSGLVVAYLAFGGDDPNRITSKAPAIASSTTIAQTERKVRAIAQEGATFTDGVPWYARTIQPPASPRVGGRDVERARPKNRIRTVHSRDPGKRTRAREAYAGRPRAPDLFAPFGW